MKKRKERAKEGREDKKEDGRKGRNKWVGEEGKIETILFAFLSTKIKDKVSERPTLTDSCRGDLASPILDIPELHTRQVDFRKAKGRFFLMCTIITPSTI